MPTPLIFTKTGNGTAPTYPSLNADGSFNIYLQNTIIIPTLSSDPNGDNSNSNTITSYVDTGISVTVQPGYVFVVTPNPQPTSTQTYFFTPVYIRGGQGATELWLTSLMVRGNSATTITAGTTAFGIGILLKSPQAQ